MLVNVKVDIPVFLSTSFINSTCLSSLSGGVRDQVWHVVSSEGTVQTHAGQGGPAHWWIREGQEGEDI